VPVRLTRTVRFSVNDAVSGAGEPSAREGKAANGFAGHPSMRGLGRHYELDVFARGEVDERTGYFVNIAEVDAAARRAAIPVIQGACDAGEGDAMAALARVIGAMLGEMDGRFCGARWRLSPTYSLEMEVNRMDVVVMRQRFEFAAAHRLHVASMSEEENRRIFGKCNHPSGHGHNYHVEPAVEVGKGSRFSLADLERITQERVVSRYDHTFLNVDAPEFGEEGGVTPSVENIARACYERLAAEIGAAGGRLREVTVWETEKTSCTYPG